MSEHEMLVLVQDESPATDAKPRCSAPALGRSTFSTRALTHTQPQRVSDRHAALGISLRKDGDNRVTRDSNVITASEEQPYLFYDFVEMEDAQHYNVTEVAIQYCEKYVLQPYGWLLCFLGWTYAKKNPTCGWKCARWTYVAGLVGIIHFTFAAQLAICFQRDGTSNLPLDMIDNSTRLCQATQHLGVTLVANFLLLLSYLFGLYLFTGRQHMGSDKLFVIMQRAVIKYFEMETNGVMSGVDSDTVLRAQKRVKNNIVFIVWLYLALGILWVILSSVTRILQGFALGLFPYYHHWQLKVLWGDAMIGSELLVPLAGLCIFGFLFFDLVYLAAVVNYSIQSMFNIKYIKVVAEMVAGKNQKYSSLDIAIKDIGEARQFLSFLNGRTAFLVAVVTFNFGVSGIGGLIGLHDLANMGSTGTFTIVADLLGTLLWLCLAVVPFIQAARVSAACRTLKQTAAIIRERPFQYAKVPQLDLDSFVIYTSAVHLRAKLFGIPIYPWTVYGAVITSLLLIMLLLVTNVYTLIHVGV